MPNEDKRSPKSIHKKELHYGFFYARCGIGSDHVTNKAEEVTCEKCRRLHNVDKVIKHEFSPKGPL